jgi:hypothetical protein
MGNDNVTIFQSGTMPFYRFDQPMFSVTANLTILGEEDIVGKIVLIPIELHSDSKSYDMQLLGAVGAIIITTQYPPGWTFNKFEWKHQVSIPQVDVYYTDFQTLANYIGYTVTIEDSPNPWQDVFSRTYVILMTLIWGGVFGILSLISGWAFIDSIPRAQRQKNNTKRVFSTFRSANYGLTFVQCLLFFIRNIDLNGISGIWGYAAANMISYIPVEINYANIFLYVVYLIEVMYKQNVRITGFVENKMLYVALSVICGAAGIVSISLTSFIQSSLATAIYSTTSSGVIRISSGLLFIIVTSILIHKMKKSRAIKKMNGEKPRKISKIIYSLVVLGIAILAHGVLIVSILGYFDSPVGTGIFYWLESFLDAIIMTILVLPFVKSNIVNADDSMKTTSNSTEKISMENA